MSGIQWTVRGEGDSGKPKLPYVGTWATFSKLPEDEKSRIFNSMRAELIANGKMENKGG